MLRRLARLAPQGAWRGPPPAGFARTFPAAFVCARSCQPASAPRLGSRSFVTFKDHFGAASPWPKPRSPAVTTVTNEQLFEQHSRYIRKLSKELKLYLNCKQAVADFLAREFVIGVQRVADVSHRADGHPILVLDDTTKTAFESHQGPAELQDVVVMVIRPDSDQDYIDIKPLVSELSGRPVVVFVETEQDVAEVLSQFEPHLHTQGFGPSFLSVIKTSSNNINEVIKHTDVGAILDLDPANELPRADEMGFARKVSLGDRQTSIVGWAHTDLAAEIRDLCAALRRSAAAGHAVVGEGKEMPIFAPTNFSGKAIVKKILKSPLDRVIGGDLVALLVATDGKDVEVRAPRSGTVTQVYFKGGEPINTGTRLLDMRLFPDASEMRLDGDDQGSTGNVISQLLQGIGMTPTQRATLVQRGGGMIQVHVQHGARLAPDAESEQADFEEEADSDEDTVLRQMIHTHIAQQIPEVGHLLVVRHVMRLLKQLQPQESADGPLHVFRDLLGGPSGRSEGGRHRDHDHDEDEDETSDGEEEATGANGEQQKTAEEAQQQLKPEQEKFQTRLRKLLKRTNKRNEKTILELTKKLEGCVMPEHAQKVLFDELGRLVNTFELSGEKRAIRNFCEWLCSLPWGRLSKDNFSIAHARAVLDEDHYGVKDVKDRILELIALAKIKSSIKGKVLCFVGPPGVGKTSLGKSIARALNRKFHRFSVGGLSDVSDIKGHSRTYVNSMPGKILHAMKTVGVSNPVIMIDEIDKMSPSHRGDPFAALLEAFDPEQNAMFTDHYMDVPFDLSNVLFILTANTLDTLPAPLLDRIERIPLNSYVLEEKIDIATRYVIPKLREETGFNKVEVTEPALVKLIVSYCREAGVRSLQQHLEKIFRKTALKVEEGGPADPVTVENLEQFVGKPRFLSDKMYEDGVPPGVACGLSYTGMGGSLLWIETVSEPLKSTSVSPPGSASLPPPRPQPVHVITTGQLGDVLKESTTIAQTYARSVLATVDPSNNFFDESRIHMHFPEGAIQKDGPSAGCAIVTSFLSLAMKRPVNPNMAMTGEISLTGKVLPVGGIREKVAAARRSGISTVLLPTQNDRDWHELPDSLKRDIVVHFVDDYKQVYDLVFPGASAHAQTSASAASAGVSPAAAKSS